MYQIRLTFAPCYFERIIEEGTGILPMVELQEAADEAFHRQGIVQGNVFSLKTPAESKEVLELWGSQMCENLEALENECQIEVVDCDSREEVRKQLNELISVEEFRALIEELMNVAPQVEQYKLQEVFLAQNYLFALNEGCGLTTYLNIFQRVLEDMGLFRCEEEPVEYQLEEGRGVEDASPLKRCLEYIKTLPKGVVCLDLVDWILRLREPIFKRFLQELNQYQKEFVFVFRIPFLERDALKRVRKDLSDLMLVRLVPFAPFTREDYSMYLDRLLCLHGFTLAEDTKNAIEDKIKEEKRDGYFYGFRTIRKIADELMYAKICSLQGSQTGQEHVIYEEDIRKILNDEMEPGKSGLELLEEMEGLEEVKAWVKELVQLAELRNQGKPVDLPVLHAVFVGSPGTGKTTAARIIGKILREHRLLGVGNFLEVSGRDLCGRCVGETAPKTMAVCRDARGSVLFIDEAYSLCQGRREQGDFGYEALVTLMTEMENHRHDMMVILSGYEKEMEALMEMNPGVRSRIPQRFIFHNYSRQQLCDSFLKRVRQHFRMDSEFETCAVQFFMGISEDKYCSRDFGNMRMVRNLYEKVVTKAYMRRQFTEDEEWLVKKEDFEAATAEPCFKNLL